MTVKQVEKIVHHEPPQPYQLLLSDGEEVLVRHARKSHVSGDRVALVGICRKKGMMGIERFRMIHVDRIVSAEFVATPVT